MEAPPEGVWGVLMDPETLCSLAASCESARKIDETHYEGWVRIRLGFVSVRAYAHGEVLEAEEPHRMVVALRGETLGMPGRFTGTARLWMDPVEGRTHARYTFQVSLLGRLDSLGRPFVQPTAQRLASTFARKVGAYLRER